MTSKEAFIKIRELTNTYHHYFVKENIKVETVEEYPLDQIEKDLEDYEKLKNLMGTPIQDIMKCLKILEILKKELVIETEYNYLTEKYDVFIYDERGFGEKIKIVVDKDKGDLLKEWLDEK